MHVDDLTFLAAAQILGSDNLYLGRPGDTADPDKRTDVDELITKLLGADAAGITPFYESGTWTPTLGAQTTQPTVSYGAQEGLYTRVGDLVWVYMRLVTTLRTGGSGAIRFNGLPYTASASSYSTMAARPGGVTLGEGTVYGYTVIGTPQLALGVARDGLTPVFPLITSWASTSDVIMSGVYLREP